MTMENFPSPGASCGSPYSDVTSGSPSQYSDAFEPVSPDYSIDSLRAEYSVQSSSSPDSAAEDPVVEDSKTALVDYRFYQTLAVGTPDGVQSHLQHLMNKYSAGCLGLPSRTALSGSRTPYSDIAQPKKPGKEGTIKRPMNAFMCFAKAERGHLMAGQPELHNARISKHLGDVWKQCPVAVKDPYIEMAQWLKELHRQEHPEYKYRPRKRKASGSTAPASSGTAEGPKPAKTARKPAKPRSRAARKPAGQAHVVPTSTLAEVPPPADYTEQLHLYADVTRIADNVHCDFKPVVGERHQLPADVKPTLHAPPAARAEADVPIAALVEERHPGAPKEDMASCEEFKNNGLDLSWFEEPLGSLGDLPDFSDEFGFELSSENLLQGAQVHDALDIDFDVEVAGLLNYNNNNQLL